MTSAAPPLPSLLLVHGAWHGPWAWDRLRPELAAHGDYDVRAVALATSGADVAALGDFDDDVAVICAAVEAIEGPCVVVAHSYGGLPTTEAVCDLPGVLGVVYVAAFVADVGETAATVVGSPPDWWDMHLEEGYLDATDPIEVFYDDVPPDLARECAARLTHQAFSTRPRPLRAAAWRHVPTSYVVCDHDRGLPVEAQESMARHAVRVHHLPSSHSPFLSMPDRLAALLHGEVQRLTQDAASRTA